jgi:hypothetical protein
VQALKSSHITPLEDLVPAPTTSQISTRSGATSITARPLNGLNVRPTPTALQACVRLRRRNRRVGRVEASLQERRRRWDLRLWLRCSTTCFEGIASLPMDNGAEASRGNRPTLSRKARTSPPFETLLLTVGVFRCESAMRASHGHSPCPQARTQSPRPMLFLHFQRRLNSSKLAGHHCCT